MDCTSAVCNREITAFRFSELQGGLFPQSNSFNFIRGPIELDSSHDVCENNTTRTNRKDEQTASFGPACLTRYGRVIEFSASTLLHSDSARLFVDR